MNTSFNSSLDFTTCIRKIIDISSKNNGSFIVKNNGEFFSIRKIEYTYTNSFLRNYYGKLVKGEKCTFIEGKFRLPIIIKMSIAIFYCIILSVDIFIIFRALFENNPELKINNETLFGSLIVLCIMKVIVFNVVKKGIDLGRESESHIIHFVKSIFEIKDQMN